MNHMMWSISMSSLESPSKYMKTPEGAKKPWNHNRLCNSLNRKQRQAESRHWRRSWDLQDEAKHEELWKNCLQSDQGLHHANLNEIRLKEFLEQYATMSEWLNSLQAQRGQFMDKFVLTELANELTKRQKWRTDINETAKAIIKSCPGLKEEIQWRTKHLNSQWDSLEKILCCKSADRSSNCRNSLNGDGEVVHDMDWLRHWLQKMENELKPLDFRSDWTAEQFEEQMERHKALQAEIELKAAEVHIVLRGSNPDGRSDNKRTERLERRWHQLRLRVLEWLELLNGVEHRARFQKQDSKKDHCGFTYAVSEEESHEPLTKYRRLGGSSSNLQQQVVPTVVAPVSSRSCGTGEGRDNSESSGVEPEEISVEDIRGQQQEHRQLSAVVVTAGNNYETSLHVQVNCDEQDWEMGQSHETEGVFNQSGSPVPNSTVEFTFVSDNSGGGNGIKRKLSTSSSAGGSTSCRTTPHQDQQQHEQQVGSPYFHFEQVVPKNIATYYFKHSDTEPESLTFCNQPGEDSKENFQVINKADNAADYDETAENSRSRDAAIWAKPVSLEAGQTVEMLPPGDALSKNESTDATASFALDVAMEEGEPSSLDNLDDIEVLVHNAELLVNTSGVVDELLLDHFHHRDDEVLMRDLEQQQRHTFALMSSSFSGSQQHLRKSFSKKHKMKKSFSADKDLGMDTSAEAKNGKGAKRHSRVRRWIRAHNKGEVHKNASSCDASAESTSESDSNSSESECPVSSSDEPTTVSASTWLNQTAVGQSSQDGQSLMASSQSLSGLKGGASTCSSNVVLGGGACSSKLRTPPSSSTSGGGVVWRSKKRSLYMKQRPKSFTEALNNGGVGDGSSSHLLDSPVENNCYFVSDTALNFIGKQTGNWSSSTGSAFLPSGEAASFVDKDKRKSKIKKKSYRLSKRKAVDNEDHHQGGASFVRSTSFSEYRLNDRVVPQARLTFSGSEGDSSRRKCGGVGRVQNSDTASLTTEDLQCPNDQDWDSYQEKYLSEPYSEELYDPDGTSNLLAFGEDYGKYLDQPDSDCSSSLGEFEQNPRKRRPLVLLNRSEMPESDSDREELNYLLSQSTAQLRIVEGVFKKRLVSSIENLASLPAEFMEMDATCVENINSLQLILANVQHLNKLPFEVDIKGVQGVVDKWHNLKDKIGHASKLQQIQEDMGSLKKDFDTVQSRLEKMDPFDTSNLTSLEHKILTIQSMLANLTERKGKLQSLNEASLDTQIHLKDSNAVEDIKHQIQELYSLYEENFQLGSYLLDKMRFLQDAWEKFETEKAEFEKTLSSSTLKTKARKDLSCAASSDSGHGTDFSHDSSISDSDMDFQERRKKLVALRQRACDLKAFLPPGSPVMDVIDQKIDEAQKEFEELRNRKNVPPLDLKIIYPKKRATPASRKSASRKSSRMPQPPAVEPQPAIESVPKVVPKPSRRWRIVRLTLTFHLALMGLLAAAYFLQPKCCEWTNSFRCSLVPHLTHDSLPTI